MDITLGLTSVSSSLTANLKTTSLTPTSGFDIISGGPIGASNLINLPALNKTPTSVNSTGYANSAYPYNSTFINSISASFIVGQVGVLREFFAGISGTSISSSVNNISKSYSVGLNPTQTNISNAIIHSDIMISTHGVSDSSSVNSIGADYSIIPTGNTIKAFETPIAFIRAKSDERYIAFIRPRTTIDKYRK